MEKGTPFAAETVLEIFINTKAFLLAVASTGMN
jgi:hypothetical protein